MSAKFHKVVGSLPPTLEPDAFYFVRIGEGFDLYVSDATGSVAHKVNTAINQPAPEITLTPEIQFSETPRIGTVLTLDPGAATGGATAAVQWFRGDQPIAGATGTTHTVVAADRGNELVARVQWSNAGGQIEAQASARIRIRHMEAQTLGLAIPRNQFSQGGTAWLNAIQAAGTKAVRFDFYFDQIQTTQGGPYDWSAVESLVDGCVSRGIVVLGILNGWRAGASDETYSTTADQDAFGQFAGAAADYFKGRVDYWALYNEPNLEKMTPESWVELGRRSYPAIKEANPAAFVLGPNLAGAIMNTNGMLIGISDWMTRMYAAGGGAFYDAMGYHPYTWPWWPSDPDDFTGWNLMVDVLRPAMVAAGEGHKKVWITEFGYPTGSDGTDPIEVEWLTETYQEEVFDEFIDYASQLDWVGPLFWYSWQDYPAASDTEDFFGLRRPGGQNKPAYDRFVYHANTFPSLT